MKFKTVYKCQRCGVVFEGIDLEIACEFPDERRKHEHICAVGEHGVGHSVGYNVIDEARDEQALQHKAAHEAIGRAFGII